MIQPEEGLTISCEIQGIIIEEAKLHHERGRWFICQDIKSGSSCNDKLGYCYSWEVNQFTETDRRENEVTSVRVIGKARDSMMEFFDRYR